MVTSWIFKSLGKEIADSVEYMCDAIKLWKELEDRYDQTNEAKLYQIQNEINDLSQGVLDITVYYTRIKKLWEELSNLNAKDQCSCACSCGGKENIHKAFALLVQEEKQRKFKPSNQMFAEGSSMNSSMIPSVNASSSSSSNGGQQFRKKISTSSNYNGRSRPYCEHCRRPGHTKDRCLLRKGNATNAFGMDTTQTAGDVDGSSSGIGSTSGGSHFQLGNGEAAGNHVASGAANFAGPFNEEASGDW
ncbi:uncharacterized protein [Solanum tuberosum]|uniref:uncharacterized protein n=1 Tax=Solanum tuberosum TaxID=4113 RepID=UPI00073A19F9|nr:PREDICTED: uncharacterized protein LOC107058423 [Solanum tuberosum]